MLRGRGNCRPTQEYLRDNVYENDPRGWHECTVAEIGSVLIIDDALCYHVVAVLCAPMCEILVKSFNVTCGNVVIPTYTPSARCDFASSCAIGRAFEPANPLRVNFPEKLVEQSRKIAFLACLPKRCVRLITFEYPSLTLGKFRYVRGAFGITVMEFRVIQPNPLLFAQNLVSAAASRLRKEVHRMKEVLLQLRIFSPDGDN